MLEMVKQWLEESLGFEIAIGEICGKLFVDR